MTALVVVVVLSLADRAAWSQEGAPPSQIDDLLAEGWHLYSEELDFERAAEVYTTVVESASSTDVQLLEAYEYLAACHFALGDEARARDALADLLAINHSQQLNDPSHPPALQDLLEQVRTAEPEPEPEPEPPPGVPAVPIAPEPEPEAAPETTPEPEGETLEPTGGGRTPWYRSWWFWTLTGAVVAAGVTVAVVLAVPGEEQPPPTGQLDPGVVQLPCTGFRF